MERNCNRRAHVNIVAYARALWAATKKKRRNTAIAIIIPMVLLEMVTAAFRGFGSPTGNGGGGSVIYVIYPLFILVCCIAASFGMSRKYEIPVLRVPVWGEWVVRWIIFVLLPFFFFLFVTHLLDIFVATPKSVPMPILFPVKCSRLLMFVTLLSAPVTLPVPSKFCPQIVRGLSNLVALFTLHLSCVPTSEGNFL